MNQVKKTILLIFISVFLVIGVQIDEPCDLFRDVFAEEKGLKAGMVHPETDKKIKYWAAPMDPTYIRDEPGKSPMGMDLVPVYEDEKEEEDPAPVGRTEPAAKQSIGLKAGTMPFSLLLNDLLSVHSQYPVTFDHPILT